MNVFQRKFCIIDLISRSWYKKLGQKIEQFLDALFHEIALRISYWHILLIFWGEKFCWMLKIKKEFP